MPVYKFRCGKCKNIEELFCRFSEKENQVSRLKCSKCGSNMFTEIFRLNIPKNESGSGHTDSCGCTSCNTGTCDSCY